MLTVADYRRCMLVAVCVVSAMSYLYYRYEEARSSTRPLSPSEIAKLARNQSVDLGSVLQVQRPDRSADIPGCKFCARYNLSQPVLGAAHMECAPFRTATVCYDRDEKPYLDQPVWGQIHISRFQSYLNKHHSLGFIDIGCDIGVYALAAAQLGHRVVCVDADIRKLRFVHQALVLEQEVSENVVLLHNAVSDARTLATVIKMDLGSTLLREVGEADAAASDAVTINTILMDDLLEMCSFSEAILKIDNSGFEHRSFAYAERLFKDVYFPVVMMDWARMRTINSTATDDWAYVMRLLDFFDLRLYSPMSWDFEMLYVEDWQQWPSDILWVEDDSFISLD